MTALVIDDEFQIRRLLRMALESKGFKVHEAASGQLGLQEAAFTRPDVVILDLGLPDMDGCALLKRLREWSDVPVLILSVLDQEDVKVVAFEAGADDYVTKPFGTAELLARLYAIQRRQKQFDAPESVVGPLLMDFALRVHINHLRNKLGQNGIELRNEPGIGYRLLYTDLTSANG